MSGTGELGDGVSVPMSLRRPATEGHMRSHLSMLAGIGLRTGRAFSVRMAY